MKQNVKLQLNQAHSRLTNNLLTAAIAAFAGVAGLVGAQPALAQSAKPTVFQAAGPSVASIQSTVDQFRAALGAVNNGNNPADPDGRGRREINWDGGNPAITTTSLGATPFTVFLATRGANITTPGTGFVQGTPQGLADTFGNPSYATIFHTFSPSRLFSPIGSNVTEIEFFVPGGNNIPAAVTGFGVVLNDVDAPDGTAAGSGSGNRHASTRVEFFGVRGELLFTSPAPAAPGDGNQSFLGIVFADARIARVRITAGDVAPGRNDGRLDIVMMDDFLYGEPTPLN
jgi:hypothetical protein